MHGIEIAFLTELDKDIWMDQPKGFEIDYPRNDAVTDDGRTWKTLGLSSSCANPTCSIILEGLHYHLHLHLHLHPCILRFENVECFLSIPRPRFDAKHVYDGATNKGIYAVFRRRARRWTYGV